MMEKPPSIHDEDGISNRTRKFYINTIFERQPNNTYTKSALLYQDILNFNITDSGEFVKKFTFNDLAKWLMKRNLDFATYYSGSKAHVSMSNRIANRRDSIQKCISDLVNSRLLRIVGSKKAEKNNFLIDLYEFTWAGLCLSLLLHYKGIDIPFIELSYNVIGSIVTHLAIQRSRINCFTADLYSKSGAIEECGKAILDLLWRMLHDDDKAVQNRYLSEFLDDIIYLLLRHREISPSFFENVFKKALFQLDEETRALILQDMKLKVENEIMQIGAPEDYERLWFANVNNHSEVVLYGQCRKCSEGSPVIISLLEYFAKYSDELLLKCARCDSEDSLNVGVSIPAKYLPEEQLL